MPLKNGINAGLKNHVLVLFFGIFQWLNIFKKKIPNGDWIYIFFFNATGLQIYL